MGRSIYITIFGIAMSALHMSIQAQSFDCAKASSAVEREICSDHDLRGLDAKLGITFKRAVLAASDQETFIARQRQWLGHREACIVDDTENQTACLKVAYQARIDELDRWVQRHSSADAANAARSDPRTECRDSWDTDHEHFIQCVADGTYDPCDDAGGTWGKAQCAWAYNEIAERRITKSENRIRKLLNGDKHNALTDFEGAEKDWHAFRERYCRFTNTAEDLPSFPSANSDMDLGYCERRLAEKHADELELILGMTEHRQD